MSKETKSKNQAVGQALVVWYQTAKRDLPWRRTQEAYPIWVSETMLQQTRVDTVIPYYHRFLERFPTAESLAEATEEDVVGLWQGLGYYSRARNLQAGVREMVTSYGGKLPKERASLEKLRGVGPYTAGALLSLVYNLPEAAVDGNVFRVVTRLMALPDEIDKPQTRRIVTDYVLSIMPEGKASDFNQALMELGATVCSPRSPQCMFCPVQVYCQAYEEGNPEEFPKKKSSKPPTPVRVVAGVLFQDGQVLLRKRPAKGLLAGMWEFPSMELDEKENSKDLAAVQSVFSEVGIKCTTGELLYGVEHIFSHRKWELLAYKMEEGLLPKELPENWAWFDWGDPKDILWAGPHGRIAQLLVTG